MIKFFRKIRQNLLTENKTGKYFKYAIGEIVLVVIGILIALQINNWNQDITSKNELEQILKEVSNDLEQDIFWLDQQIENGEGFVNNVDYLLGNGNNMPVDSLLHRISAVYRYTYFIPVSFGYNKFNKHPRTELLPDRLTNDITIYYSGFSIERNSISLEINTLYSLNAFRNYLVKYGFPLEVNELKRLEDLSNLNDIINDIEFIGILRTIKNNWSVELYVLNTARTMAKNNLETINNYLSSINGF
ncbi:DUF6090 family protein [Patiriisocius sp. Uisw_017]|uniref:DUF6090 family protein n=1 Tax=Patiriisocius sp. Uisw_017 TaxID=3230968 RepID=UPI0039E83F39